jgi:hypothetical protein
MSKQLVLAALNTVEQRIGKRGDFYTDEGRTYRLTTCSQLAYELEKGSLASFQRCWGNIQRGNYWEPAMDALDEVFDELGINNVDELYALVAVA